MMGTSWLFIDHGWRLNLKNGFLLGDNHYLVPNDFFENVKIFAPKKERTVEDPNDPEQVISTLTRKDQALNKQIRTARSRIENTFFQMRKIFSSLSTPFREDVKELDVIVTIAAGVFNA